MRRMSLEKKEELGWTRPLKAGGRPSGVMERYLTTHGRLKKEDCDHSQVLDEVYPVTMWCLDCGELLDISKREPIGKSLNDAKLVEKRRKFNDIWFDKTYKLNQHEPDDPVQEEKVNEQLQRDGIKKL